MKLLSHLLRRQPLLLAAGLLGLAFPAPAAQTHTNAPTGPAPALTNALPVKVEIPKSVFIIPTTPQEGKDPFFPRSTRLYASVVIKSNSLPAAAAAVIVDLKLNGISGTSDHRLAIINNRTFGPNEEGAVSTALGPVRIRCLEIKADSVLVQVGGEQRVLRLRSGF